MNGLPPTPPGALAAAVAAAQEAGRIAREALKQPKDVTVKGRGNLVTETDFRIERFLQDTFKRDFPDFAILSEETAADTPTAGWVWVIDPLDGTKNFVSGIPFFCINIALCHDGQPAVAVTYDPNQDECFSAVLGSGTFVNDTPVRASSVATVTESVLAIDLGYDNERGRATLDMASRRFPDLQALRIPGSAALGLAYAASGRYDLFVHRFLLPWDIAAGILLVQEAGGTVTDVHGQPVDISSQTVVAGGADVHRDFLSWERAQ